MTITIRGYGGGNAIVTWGYGNLTIPIIVSEFLEVIDVKFTKLNGKISLFNLTNDTAAFMSRIISESSDDLVVIPPDGNDLEIIPTVSVQYNSFDKIKTIYQSFESIDAFMLRVISEEPIIQGTAPDGNDLQVIPTVSVFYEKSDSIYIQQDITNEVNTKFIRIIPEEL
jgi:hypothetical protein